MIGHDVHIGGINLQAIRINATLQFHNDTSGEITDTGRWEL